MFNMVYKTQYQVLHIFWFYAILSIIGRSWQFSSAHLVNYEFEIQFYIFDIMGYTVRSFRAVSNLFFLADSHLAAESL